MPKVNAATLRAGIALVLAFVLIPGSAGRGAPPAVEPPGERFVVPPLRGASGAPEIYEHSQEAGPDETFFLVGRDFSRELFVWGVKADDAAGGPIKAEVQLAGDHYLAATLPERAYEGPFVVAAKNKAGYSRPIVLNSPQPWWCHPNPARPGDCVRIFGRNLARRPDWQRAFVYLGEAGRPGRWLDVVRAGKYSLEARIPGDVEPGDYELWLHAGRGGSWGWSEPLKLHVAAAAAASPLVRLRPASAAELQQALDALATRGGGTVELPAGTFPLEGTLRIPAHVALRGAGHDATWLQLATSPAIAFPRFALSGWGVAPAAMHSRGDKEGRLPGADRAAVWLAGDGAALTDLTVLGNAQVNHGITIRPPQPTAWLAGCRVERVRLAECEGKQGENCGLYVHNVRGCVVRDNELWGRSPLFLAGARQSVFAGNRLVSVTRFGGNAEAAIQGRTEPVEECLIENNLVAAPPGAGAGGPTARRLIWISTGHGSVTHNWLSGNGAEAAHGPGAAVGAGQARFGGVAGTDQNVGETILFEGNHRTAYFGPLQAADAQSVTLPQMLPPTPAERLGSVRREQLAHDAQGRETPFWPPDADDGGGEPPLGEYFVTIFQGRGQGQTRRVLRRDGPRLTVDRPWRVAPEKGSLAAVGVAFYQNLIVGNHTPEGMTGIQLWISCVENVIAGNTIARQRKPGLFLYANGTTLGSSMPRTWNRGVSPLFWNVAEGNRAEECSDGALLTSGDAADLPIEFPRALGNVLRHNSFIRSRGDGVLLTSRKGRPGVNDTSASIVGTILEFNVVRDAANAYHAGESCDTIVIRRNHAYFWYPVNNSPKPPAAFLINHSDTKIAIEANTVEGRNGVAGAEVVEIKRADKNEATGK